MCNDSNLQANLDNTNAYAKLCQNPSTISQDIERKRNSSTNPEP